MAETECKDNLVELERKIAHGLVTVNRSVLQTTTRIIEMTMDGVREQIDTQIQDIIYNQAEDRKMNDSLLCNVDRMIDDRNCCTHRYGIVTKI